MSRLSEAVARVWPLGLRVRRLRRRSAPDLAEARPYQVLTVVSNKGGVGKTTLAANLAIYLRELSDTPVLLVGLDDQALLDRMFAVEPEPPRTWRTAALGLRVGDLSSTIRAGRFGVHFVPSPPDLAAVVATLPDAYRLDAALRRTAWRGLVVVDTKSDLGIVTQNAIAASDLVLVPVKDDGSLQEARKVFALLERWGWPRERARIVLSMIDRHIKYRGSEAHDVLALLLSQIRNRQYPLFERFVSRSPLVESLGTNPEERPGSILHEASGSVVWQQMRHLAEDVAKALALRPGAFAEGEEARAPEPSLLGSSSLLGPS